MSTEKEKAFIRLIVAGEQRILGYLTAIVPSAQDAEDLMQETSIVMWEKFDEFLSTQEGQPDLGRFIAWGNKIAFYKVLNSRRNKKWRLRLLSDDVVALVADEWTRQDESGALGERHTALSDCIDSLPAERRGILEGYYWERMPVDRIASRFKKTSESVYKVLQRTRQALHRCIELNVGN